MTGVWGRQRRVFLMSFGLLVFWGLVAAGAQQALQFADTAPRETRETLAPAKYGGTTDLAAHLASGGAARANIEAARVRLGFEPLLPTVTGGRALRGLYTRSDRFESSNSTQVAAPDDLFHALYVDDLQVIEKLWEPGEVRDETTFGRRLLVNYTAPERFVRTAKLKGLTVWTWDRVSLPESTDSDGRFVPGLELSAAQVSWFRDGVGYIVASPYLTADQLLPIAASMIR